ncbi:hypothetical protein OGM63_04560 [Plectonema radiosum NIES-515]|jgi:hypothetical protein|uniref:Uncharacterized protein n=1 Tax=Plectonema radiosum NIES-515 TaxID=2986073 RepID=A0ABT3AVR8_9CYAN|nr:hypothetical protein [Plectonema radiosum]MCV3212805.1 hypothetical protein [Plectonema radiosum NIES-515]
MPEDSPININPQAEVIIIALGDIHNQGVIGKITGDVANIMNDTPGSQQADISGITALIAQLQKRIENNNQLSPMDKAQALQQVKALAFIDRAKNKQVMTATSDELLSDEP